MLWTPPIAFFWVALAALFPLLAQAADKTCTARDGSAYYDLNPLKGSKDYTFKAPGGRGFTINICRSVVSETWNVHDVDDQDDIAAMTRRLRGDFSLGKSNTTVVIQDRHPVLTFQGGSKCLKSDSMRAATVVRFICDRSVFGAGKPELIAQLPPEDDDACAFFIEWRTHYACPTGEPSGFWGWILSAIALTVFLFIAYLVTGIVYKRVVLGERGLAQLPPLSCAPICGACVGGARLVGSRARSIFGRRGSDADRYGSAWPGWGSRGSDGFARIPSSLEEAQGMLDDDEESETPRQSVDEQQNRGFSGAAGANPWSHHSQTVEQAASDGRPAGMDNSGVIRL